MAFFGYFLSPRKESIPPEAKKKKKKKKKEKKKKKVTRTGARNTLSCGK